MIGGHLFGGPAAVTRYGGNPVFPRMRFILLGALIAYVWTSAARGQTGTVHNLVGGGLRMTVESRWPDGAGYRPVRVTITPTGAVMADRTLSFEFTTTGYSRGREDKTRVVQDIELPAGSGVVTATLAVPYLTGHSSYSFRVAEDSLWIPGLAAGSSFQANAGMETLPRVLFIADRTPDSSKLGRVFFNINIQQGNPQSFPLQTLHTVSVKDLPSRWIDYSALDIVLLSFDDLRGLTTSRPDVFQALLDWTAAGGNLLVFDVGSDWERREQLEQLIGLPATVPSADDIRDPGWQAPQTRQFGKRVEGIGSQAVGPFEEIDENYEQVYSGYGYQQTRTTVQRQPKDEQTSAEEPPPSAPESPPFVSRSFEMGMLVAIATGKPFDEDAGFWAWLCNHLTSRRTIWYQRHGVSLHQDNPEFFKFLIQGVGKAPLNAFRILITLFVLAIGPVNYYLLRRLRRLHVLVVTVPVSAAAVTLALFAYALFSDGLGTRVRVRSVTQINQATGQTECWARLSYYSGMAPGDGLRFSDDVAVYPIEPVVGDQNSGNRELIWYRGQKLASGWLRSRTPTQYLTVRSRKSELGIDVGRIGSGRVSVANRLGTDVDLLILRGEDGNFYRAFDLAEGAETEATIVKGTEAVAELLPEINRVPMTLPPGFDVTRLGYRRRYYYNPYSGDQPNATPATSLMEGAIQDVAKSSPSLPGGLEPKSYVAVVRFSPEVELGTPVARPESSLHLVVGSW